LTHIKRRDLRGAHGQAQVRHPAAVIGNLEIDQRARSQEVDAGASRRLSVTSMATVKPRDDVKAMPAPAAQASQSDQPLMEERRTIIAEYASYLREVLKRLRKRSN
jgi:hypothetical protein